MGHNLDQVDCDSEGHLKILESTLNPVSLVLLLRCSKSLLKPLERPLASLISQWRKEAMGPDGESAFHSLQTEGCMYPHPREEEIINLIDGNRNPLQNVFLAPSNTLTLLVDRDCFVVFLQICICLFLVERKIKRDYYRRITSALSFTA